MAIEPKKRWLPRVPPQLFIIVSVLGAVVVAFVVIVHLHVLEKFVASVAVQAAIFILAIIAIAFACIQFADARQQSVEMEQIAKSMSTRYIGMFPRDMDDIIDVVKAAEEELLIISDFPDYGSYSNPKAFRRLLDELLYARENGISVRWIIYDDKLAETTLQNQFREADFQDTQKSQRYRAYCEHWPGLRPRDSNVGFTHADFLDILRDKCKGYKTILLDKGVKFSTLSEKLWLFFFMQDRQEAVFLFEDIGAEEHGLAFHTRDAKLVETFVGIFERCWKQKILADGPTRG